jgi:hypothetical protein
MTRESAISRATRHFDDGEFIADLARRVAYRTESQVPESRPHLGAYLAQELGPAFERIGFKVQVFENPVAGGGPLLLAERLEDPGLPTVLSYGHGDVIRGLADQWRTGLSPWELKQEADAITGGVPPTTKRSIRSTWRRSLPSSRNAASSGFNAKFLIETGRGGRLARIAGNSASAKAAGSKPTC